MRLKDAFISRDTVIQTTIQGLLKKDGLFSAAQVERISDIVNTAFDEGPKIWSGTILDQLQKSGDIKNPNEVRSFIDNANLNDSPKP